MTRNFEFNHSVTVTFVVLSLWQALRVLPRVMHVLVFVFAWFHDATNLWPFFLPRAWSKHLTGKIRSKHPVVTCNNALLHPCRGLKSPLNILKPCCCHLSNDGCCPDVGKSEISSGESTAFSLKFLTLHYITLHYTTLHYITLHYTTLHYITLHYTTTLYTKAIGPIWEILKNRLWFDTALLVKPGFL